MRASVIWLEPVLDNYRQQPPHTTPSFLLSHTNIHHPGHYHPASYCHQPRGIKKTWHLILCGVESIMCWMMRRIHSWCLRCLQRMLSPAGPGVTSHMKLLWLKHVIFCRNDKLRLYTCTSLYAVGAAMVLMGLQVSFSHLNKSHPVDL